jgi:hypothetical protein
MLFFNKKILKKRWYIYKHLNLKKLKIDFYKSSHFQIKKSVQLQIIIIYIHFYEVFLIYN